MMGTLHKSPDEYFIAAKGSAEHLLEKCTWMRSGEALQKMGRADRKKILEEGEKMATEGLRVLGFAYKETDAEPDNENFMDDLVYAGLLGFLDPPRTDIKDAIVSCKKAGIKVVMITGDHPMTALNIAQKTGLAEDGEKEILIGKDLPEMESLSEEWNEKILSTVIFARTNPKQKLEIVEVYQKAGNIVAMTGDGVNDAPALKKADIGIAMGFRGTQVAKETASIVLKDDSFATIAEAVCHGRVIFQNIQKFVIYLVSCNLSEIFIVTALGFIAPASTLLAMQILFLNMVTDVFPALALGLGRGNRSIMERPPRHPEKDIISKKEWILVAIYSAAITFAVIVAVLYSKNVRNVDDKTANNVAFLSLAFAQLFHVFNMSSSRSGLLVNEITKNKFVWLALFICAALLILVYVSPMMRLVLGIETLSAEIWMVALLAGLIPLVLVQLYKIIYLVKIKNRKNGNTNESDGEHSTGKSQGS
jgi:P-type Ca2+ transporter type 2C